MRRCVLTVGHGYTAQALVRRLAPEGWEVIATTRDPDKAARLRSAGLEARLWPAEPLGPLLERASHVLISAGPGPEGDPVLSLERDAIEASAPDLIWLGYLSTTGVYGHSGGAWVDEDTRPDPATSRGVARLHAERAWQSIDSLPLHIFRLPGIYGPGRGPLAKLRAGRAQAVINPGQLFSRAHVDDIANALALSMNAPEPGAIYNICDDEPAPPEDVLDRAAALLGLASPARVGLEDAELTPMARSFYAESKRVSNRRAKARLGWQPLYPSYREGLQAVFAAEQAQHGEED